MKKRKAIMIFDSGRGRMHLLLQVFMLLILSLAAPASGNAERAQLEKGAPTLIKDEAKVVQPGDSTDLLYLCRIRSGAVVASSIPVSEADPISNIYVKRKESGPLTVLAVRPDEPLAERLWPGPFEEEILERLVRSVAGMKEGETRKVELTAVMISPKDEQSGFGRLAKVRTRPKKMIMPKGDYEFRARKAPEVGQTYAYDPAFPGTVEAITDTDVILRFSATPGEIIQTPFGPGLIREEGEEYKIDIQATEGSLVRTGNKIGRITGVDEKVIVIDYRHPFGYETLICDVTAENVVRTEPLATGPGVQ